MVGTSFTPSLPCCRSKLHARSRIPLPPIAARAGSTRPAVWGSELKLRHYPDHPSPRHSERSRPTLSSRFAPAKASACAEESLFLIPRPVTEVVFSSFQAPHWNRRGTAFRAPTTQDLRERPRERPDEEISFQAWKESSGPGSSGARRAPKAGLEDPRVRRTHSFV